MKTEELKRDIGRCLEAIEKELNYERSKANRAQELLEAIYEQYAEPILAEKIRDKPYRVRGVIINDKGDTCDSFTEPELLDSELKFEVERHCISSDMFYNDFNPDAKPTFQTYWVRVGLFDNKPEAKEALKELMNSE